MDPITSTTNRHRMVEAIANGTVIDHIPAEATLKVANLLASPGDQLFIGMNLRSARCGRKGVVKISARELDVQATSRLALIAPGASICIIRDYEVVSKLPVPVPERFENVACCANPNCVTNHERWPTRFVVTNASPLKVRCSYCERGFSASELTLL